MGGTIGSMPEPRLLTYEDLATFPDDGLRRELLEGELLVSPSPVVRHQRIVGRLFFALESHVREHGGGEVFTAPLDVVLSQITVLEPDVFVVTDAQREIIEIKNVPGAPALVIEVLSDARIDRVRKRDLYAKYAVPEYWVVDPEADRVEVHHLAGDAYAKPELFEAGDALTTSALPGLSVDLAALFAR